MTVNFDTEKAVSGICRRTPENNEVKTNESKKAKSSKLSPSTVKSLAFLLVIYVVSLSVIYTSELIKTADSKTYGLAEIVSTGDGLSMVETVYEQEQVSNNDEAKRLTEEYIAGVELAAAEYVAAIESSISKEVAKTAESPTFLPNGCAFPTNGKIESGYENRRNPFYISNTTENEFEFHKGIDISVPIGSSVFAYSDGTVTEVSVSRTLGNYVVISHGKYETVYAHLNQAICSKGDGVKAGDAIAFSGATGRTLTPHLHFEVRVAGESVDPMEYMS